MARHGALTRLGCRAAFGVLLGLPSAAAAAPTELPRGYLGVALAPAAVPPLPEGMHGRYEVAGQVSLLVPSGAADQGGIELGDLILSVDGKRFTTQDGGPAAQLARWLKDRQRGARVELLLVKAAPQAEVTSDGERLDDPNAALHELPQLMEELPWGSELSIRITRQPRVVRLSIELGTHPRDRLQRRRGLPEAKTHGAPTGAPNERERFGRLAIEHHGLAKDVADLQQRLVDLHDADDGYGLADLRFVHQHPWRIAEAADAVLRDFTPAGPAALLPERIRAAAARDRHPLAELAFEPLPRDVSAEEHARAIEQLLAETTALVRQAFAPLTPKQESFLRAHWPGIGSALSEGVLLNQDSNPARRRRNLELLETVGLVDRRMLYAAALSWSRLADPEWLAALEADLSRDGRADQAFLLRRDTPFGEIVIGGRGRNRYRGFEPAVIVDLGGDDVYSNNAGSSSFAGRHAAAVIDLAGDDAYESTSDAAQGCGIGGVGLLVERAGDDRYLGLDWAQGASLLGVGMLVDRAGDDVYRARRLAQGVGLWGAGFLLDAAGDDHFALLAYGQGLGLPAGFGLLHDAGGEDRYYAKGGAPTGYGTQGVFDAWAQGSGVGFRWLQSGGIGMLVDDAGADDYEAGNFAQGGGYYFGWGLLHDRGHASDSYIGSRYNQGFAAHQAVGTFLEDAGNERYVTRNAAMAGLAWDESVSYFRDGAGDDSYLAGSFSLGASAHNSFSLFVDESGSDRYEGAKPGRAGGNDYHGGTSFSLFLDLGPGEDIYGEGGLQAPGIRVAPEHGVAADLPGDLAAHLTPAAFAEASLDEK